jgi:hypothetical protein
LIIITEEDFVMIHSIAAIAITKKGTALHIGRRRT